jgi:hypothetical protein
MNIIFNQAVKHGKREFVPGVVYGVSAEAGAYFLATGWASETADPAVVTVDAAETEIDPNTIWGTGENRGQPVISA